jgi:DeoR/GlpR family transcriptional regulator of sugar metabolism
VLDSYENEVEIKKAMMGQASETALLIDHTKFDSSVFLRFADLDEIDYVITDTKPSDEWIEICKQRKITLIY